MSDGVEDMSATSPVSARKLSDQLIPFEYLAALEALVASQAIDLRDKEGLGVFAEELHSQIREKVVFASHDRMLGRDIQSVLGVLRTRA